MFHILLPHTLYATYTIHWCLICCFLILCYPRNKLCISRFTVCLNGCGGLARCSRAFEVCVEEKWQLDCCETSVGRCKISSWSVHCNTSNHSARYKTLWSNSVDWSNMVSRHSCCTRGASKKYIGEMKLFYQNGGWRVSNTTRLRVRKWHLTSMSR